MNFPNSNQASAETEQPTEEVETVEEVATEELEESPLQSIKLASFAQDSMDKAQEVVEKTVEICVSENIDPIFNFDVEEDLPENYGISIIPLTKRITGQGNVVENVCVAAIPSMESILSTSGGEAWIRKQIETILQKSVKSAATSNEELLSLPLKVEDFITSARSSALAGFNSVAIAFVKALKEKGLTFMSKALLRQILSSQAFAGQQFPLIPAEKWELVIKSMVDHAKKEQCEAGIMDHWLATRDKVEVSEKDFDLDDLDELIG